MKIIKDRLTEIAISYWIIAFVLLYIRVFITSEMFVGEIAVAFMLGAFVLRMEDVKLQAQRNL